VLDSAAFGAGTAALATVLAPEIVIAAIVSKTSFAQTYKIK